MTINMSRYRIVQTANPGTNPQKLARETVSNRPVSVLRRMTIEHEQSMVDRLTVTFTLDAAAVTVTSPATGRSATYGCAMGEDNIDGVYFTDAERFDLDLLEPIAGLWDDAVKVGDRVKMSELAEEAQMLMDNEGNDVIDLVFPQGI